MHIIGERPLFVGQHFKAFGATLLQLTSAGEITVLHRFNFSIYPTKTSCRGLNMGLARCLRISSSIGCYARCVGCKYPLPDII